MKSSQLDIAFRITILRPRKYRFGLHMFSPSGRNGSENCVRYWFKSDVRWEVAMRTETAKCSKCGKTMRNEQPGSLTYVKDIRNPDFCKCAETQIASSGWKVVPIQPTNEQLKAMFDTPKDAPWSELYKAAIDTAPEYFARFLKRG
jgi:hypothetical protein